MLKTATNTKHCFIMRGISGSGKSVTANFITKGLNIFSTDDYSYNF